MVFQRLRGKTTLGKISHKLRAEMPRLRSEYDVRTLWVFGPYARGEAKRASRLDIMIDYERVPSLFKFVRLERNLGELLGVEVHLADKDGMEEKSRELALSEGVRM
jgi:predicted nucleotidyltransferase